MISADLSRFLVEVLRKMENIKIFLILTWKMEIWTQFEFFLIPFKVIRENLFNLNNWTFPDGFDIFRVNWQDEMSNLGKIETEPVLDMKMKTLCQFLRFFDLFCFFSRKSCLNLIVGRFFRWFESIFSRSYEKIGKYWNLFEFNLENGKLSTISIFFDFI
jgi:hypothetical protein